MIDHLAGRAGGVDGGPRRRDNRGVASYWATDDGWLYRDTEPGVEDPNGEFLRTQLSS